MSRYSLNYPSLLAALLLGGMPSMHAEEINIQPYAYSVNGYGEVQRIFGGDVNGSTRDQAISEIQALNLNSARAYFWGLAWYKAPNFIQMPKTPWNVAQYGGKGLSREESFVQWDQFYAQDFATLMEEWWEKSFPKNDQLYQSELFRKWNLNDGIVLHSELDGSADRHPEAVNRFYSAYLETIHRHAPWMNVQFLQFINEPDYSHWSGQFATVDEASETLIRCFNRLDSYAQDHFGKTRLLGPCLSSACFFSLSGWRQWTLPYLKNFRQIDYYNYHCYDVAAGPHLAWLEMLQAAGEGLRGERPRGVLTETNFRLHDSKTKKRFAWEAQQLFMALGNPDKLALRTFFLLGYPNSHEWDGTNFLVTQDGKLVPGEIYWLYWTLADLRGPLRWIRPVTGSDLKTCATFPAANELVLSLFNDGEQAITVNADPGVGKTATVLHTTAREAYYQNGILRHEERDLKASRSVPMKLVPGEVATVRWQFTDPLPAPYNTLNQTQYYCHQTNFLISSGSEVVIGASRAPRPDEVPFLRLGITTDDVLFAKEFAFTCNGKKHSVVWADLPAEVRNGFPNTWWVELPLAPNEVGTENKIKFGDLDTSYRMMSASVVYRQFPSKADAQNWLAETVRSSGRVISAAMQVPAQWFGGSQMPITWTLRNPSDKPRTYHLAMDLPPEGKLGKINLAEPVTLAPGKAKTFEDVIELKPIGAIQNAVCRLKITTDDQCSRTLTRNVYIYPRLTATYAPSSPPCDGTFSGWEGIPHRAFREKGISAETRLAWDAKNLYMRVDIVAPGAPMKADTLETFWQRDAIELFLDLNNQKSQTYDQDDFQLFFIPKSASDETAVGGIVPRTIRDDSVATGNVMIEPRFRVKAAPVSGGGYRLEAAIPWDALKPGFVGRPGQKIGCDLALDHFFPVEKSTFSNSIIGADGKPFAHPSQWGILTLMGPGERSE
jgi:hypothetical protein